MKSQRLLIVFALLSLLFPGCTDKNMAASKHAGAAVSSAAIPAVKLQRVFKDVRMDAIVFLTQAPEDDRYWYAVEKAGRVLRFENKAAVAESSIFVDITDRVDAGPSEAGLLGMAFHPQFRTNGYVYLSYTGNDAGLKSYISRFKSLDSGNSLSTDTEKRLLEVAQPYSNHNGGNILFGPDGFFYIGLGDGGAGGDPKGHGQNTQTLLGSLLRIDVDKGDPYAIPAGNPFVNSNKGLPAIFAWGLRNPWRWSFDRATGKLWLADVGQDNWEEVNIVEKPGNFGWNGKEGKHCYKTAHCENPEYIDPVIEYSHAEGCSITGGYVYRGRQIPELNGIYLYADFCSGKLWGARDAGNGVYESFQLLDTGLNISSFAQGHDGEIYILHFMGEVYRLVPQ
ncbi:MAG: PQQ-dependent sugar dehydrogenase [Gammaproteobacteria bacterium]|nr:PQQ-dependent sugar dehydrogenase [Gammaproteobacteria bacterium]